MTTAEAEQHLQSNVDQLEAVFHQHHDRVFRAAYRVTGSATDAEDVVQTVFLRLLRNEHDLGSIEDLGSYLHRAGSNAALDLVRSKRSSTTLDDVEMGIGSSAKWVPDRSHDPRQLQARLRELVAKLHPTSAEMFTLRYFEGLENSEIARLMSTTEGTVAVTLHRTRARLQREIRSYMGVSE